MTSLLQKTLGDAWHQLPRALQAHYRAGASVDEGHMVVEYPAFMQPVLHLLARWGALVSRRGPDVHTSVEKLDTADRLHWRRTMRFGDGSTHHFDSVWEPGAPGHVIDFVNPWLGLQMRPCVVGEQLHYQGVNFIVRLRRWTLRLPVAGARPYDDRGARPG